MIIAIVSGTYPPLKCGVGDYVKNLARAVADLGTEVHVVTSRSVASRPFTDGIRVAVWPEVRSWTWLSMIRVIRRISRIRPDAVLMEYPTLVYGKRTGINILPLLLRLRFPGLRQVTTLHEFEQYGILGRLRLASNILLANAVTVTTPLEKNTVLGMYPIRSSRIRVIPVGSNVPTTGTRAEGRRMFRRLGIRNGEKAALFFGWIGPGKGLPVLLESMRILKDKGERIRLVVVGPFQPTRDRFHAMLGKMHRELKLGRTALWAGYRQVGDISSMLKACDVCVLPFDRGVRMNRGSFVAAVMNGTRIVTTRGRTSVAEGRGVRAVSIPPRPGRLAASIMESIRGKYAIPCQDRRAFLISWSSIGKSILTGFLKSGDRGQGE
jgi:glycosyltransferase involved in cell wall biosynthesis